MKKLKTYCRNILDLIPNVDSMTEKLLEEYRHLGLLFSFNIKETPKFCYNVKIVSSLVMLESVFRDLVKAIGISEEYH